MQQTPDAAAQTAARIAALQQQIAALQHMQTALQTAQRQHGSIAAQCAADALQVIDTAAQQHSGIVALPLPAVPFFIQRGISDIYGSFISNAVMTAAAEQYTDALHIVGYGSIGSSTAAARLPHRSVADNAKRYGLKIPAAFNCRICGSSDIDICHNIPRAMLGNLTRDNLRIDCAACNRRQRDILPAASIAVLQYYTLVIDISDRALLEYLTD